MKGVLVHLFYSYLKLLKKTVDVDWKGVESYGENKVIGFWHEDSFFMNLVLNRLTQGQVPLDVIVTADKRGDYIQEILERFGGKAERVPDGFASFTFLKKLLQKSYEEERSLAVSLDGPLGPRHEPKKLAFYLSEQGQKEFIAVTVSYSRKLRLFWRWDHYVIPLPFSRITVELQDYGIVNKNQIPFLPHEAMEGADVVSSVTEGISLG